MKILVVEDERKTAAYLRLRLWGAWAENSTEPLLPRVRFGPSRSSSDTSCNMTRP